MADQAVEELVEAAESASYHTILEIWQGVLAPAREELVSRITPQWANRIVTTYTEVRFADMLQFRVRYFTKVLELADILDREISSEPESLNAASSEEDLEVNTFHYLNILVDWQKQFLLWELAWDPNSKFAAVEIAAMSEVHKMFFGDTGILGLLDQIKFEFTEEHKQMLMDTLNTVREGAER